ncbi:MAG: hypothetical protein A2086_17270 [Spirochaetes bacterium GWD1_27_9]|nr:MAG: hypothetical protein A2Z98_12435 [Spirochaetes bacterium GWB1_27_13]OHD42472.1 MAG: hypothetical protein A2086_17270 [Spirochaetes bacterium GWD1_27_9]
MTDNKKRELYKDYLINRNGEVILKQYISERDWEKNIVLNEIFIEVDKIAKYLKDAKRAITDMILDYMNKVGSDIDKKYTKEEITNITITSYDSNRQVEVTTASLKRLNEKIKNAEVLFKKCIVKWEENNEINEKAKTMINSFFGQRMTVTKALSICQLKFVDDEWADAVAILKDAIDTINSKMYYVFKERNKVDNKFRAINLNFTSIEV